MKWYPVCNGLVSSSYTIFTYPPIREDETSTKNSTNGYVDPEDETPANVIIDQVKY